MSRDAMFLPEYEIGLISNTSTAYEFRLDNLNYPLEEIFEAASLSGFRGKDVAAKQVKLLSGSNKIIRYWAILGLRSQSIDNLKPFSANIEKAMNDIYPPVALTASAIAYEMFGNKTSEAYLKKFCADKNMHISLMAINYLLYTKNKEPFIETIRAVHKMNDRDYNVKAACMDFLGSLGLVPNNPEYRE